MVDVVKGTAQVTLPPGMSLDDFNKAFKSFNDVRFKGKKIAKADGQALGRLKKAHKAEFYSFRVEEWKKEGLDPKGLK